MKSLAVGAIVVAVVLLAARAGGAEPPAKGKPAPREWGVLLIGKGAVQERPPLIAADGKGEADAANLAALSSARVLFHQAPAAMKPSVRAAVTSDSITLTNIGETPSGPVVVVLNDGLSRNGARVGSIPPKGEVTLSRSGMTEVSWDERETLGSVEGVWRAAGLGEADAKAACAVWREELLGRPGFLLISCVAPEEFDKAFPRPQKPEPAPARAGLFFDTLADQNERGSWLVNLDQSVAKWVKRYAEGDEKQRPQVLRLFDTAGELAEPFLRELTKDSDSTIAIAAGELLKRRT